MSYAQERAEAGNATFPIEWRNSLEAAVSREFGQRGLTMHSGGSGCGGFDLGMHVPGQAASLEYDGREDGKVRAHVVVNYSGRGPDELRIDHDFGWFDWPKDGGAETLPPEARKAAEHCIALANAA